MAVLGYAFWKGQFNGNRGVLGRTIKISGVPFRIVGVTEPRFQGLVWGYPASVSAPISQRTAASPQDPASNFYWAETIARLRGGARTQDLEAQLKTRWRRLLETSLPIGFKGANRAEIISMRPVITSAATGIDYYFREHFKTGLFALLAISLLVLLVSCGNIANLLFARGLQREREIAIRLALGAKRSHIFRQLLVESSLLLFCAIALSFVLAIEGAKLLSDFFIRSLGRADFAFSVDVDWRVLLFTAATAAATLLAFAILPTWRTSNVDPAASLKAASRSFTASRATVRKLLFIVQVSMTLVILVCAGVFSESIRYLRGNALGIRGDHVIDAQLMPVPNAGDQQTTDAYLRNLIDGIRNLPQVQRVSLTSFAPLVSSPFKEDVRRRDDAEKPILQIPVEFVTDGFPELMKLPLLEGSDFRATETETGQRTALVSQYAAERLFPQGDAVADTSNLERSRKHATLKSSES